jgi:hypothetical protein
MSAPSFLASEATRPNPSPGGLGAGRVVLFGLLVVVATAAAVLSFAALRDLALLCGFDSRLAWLLPVVVDAGAASGSLVWLGRHGGAGRRFARTLALALLGLSVAANALGHGLQAYHLAPPWWVVVVVSAIAPAVLGAVVHLAVLVGRPPPPHNTPGPDTDHHAPASAASGSAVTEDTGAVAVAESEDVVAVAGFGSERWDAELLAEDGVSRWDQDTAAGRVEPDRVELDRVEVLIAAGIGRRRLSRELDISEYEARQLLARSRGTTTPNTTDTTNLNTTDDRHYGGEATEVAVLNETGDES